MRKKHIHLLIGLIIVVISLYYAFKDVSIVEVGRALGSVNYIFIVPAFLGILMSYVFRAMRWRYLIAPIKEVRTRDLFSPLMIGFMGNMLPARAGEFIRPYLLGKKENISFSSSFATIIIERMFDMAFVLLLIFGTLFFKTEIFAYSETGANHKLIGYMEKFGWTSFIICMGILLFSVLLQYRSEWAMNVVNVCIKPFPRKWGEKIVGMVHSFNDGLKIIKDKRGFIATILLSSLIWGLFVLTYYPLYIAFDIHTKMPILSSLVVLCLTVAIFITLFPTPGFLGSFQAGCVVALHEIFGISKAVALSFGIVSWLLIMGFTVSAGAFFAFKDHISIKEITAKSEQES
jgi:uncharacterized protein (TIRG00374 family)